MAAKGEDDERRALPDVYGKMLRDLDETKRNMAGSMLMLVERGEKLDTLDRQSTDLADNSKVMVRRSYGPEGWTGDVRCWVGEQFLPRLRQVTGSMSRCWTLHCLAYVKGRELKRRRRSADDPYSDDPAADSDSRAYLDRIVFVDSDSGSDPQKEEAIGTETAFSD